MYFILQRKRACYGEDDDLLVDMIYQREKMFLSIQAYEVECSLEGGMLGIFVLLIRNVLVKKD